jgi:hypothetical protein
MAEPTLDVAPKQDVFVPFEAGVAELDPGWYDLECEVEVDGIRRAYPGGKRFSVAWPRGSTRRGAIPVDAAVKLAGTRYAFERLDCAADHAKLRLRSTPPTAADVALAVDGAPLPVLDVDRDDDAGVMTITAYPLLKSHERLRIEVRTGDEASSVDVAMP